MGRKETHNCGARSLSWGGGLMGKCNSMSWEKQRPRSRLPILCAVLLIACGTTDWLCAAPLDSPEQNDWDVRVGLPLWVAGLKGTVGVKGRDAHVDEDFSDIADILDFALALNIEIRKQRWLF